MVIVKLSKDITDTRLIWTYFLVPTELLLISAQKVLDIKDPDSTDFHLVWMTFPDPDLQTITVTGRVVKTARFL